MQDATLIEKNRPLAEPSNRRHVVRDEKNRPSFLADVFHLVQAPTLKARITDRQNLIHQQDFGFQVGGYGESEANVHTARVALDGRVEELLDVGEGYDLVELALDLAIAHAQDRSIQVNILSPGQLGMEAGSDFQQGPDTAKDLGSALCRTGYSGEDLQKGGLSRSIPADDPHDFPSFYFERDVAQRPETAGHFRCPSRVEMRKELPDQSPRATQDVAQRQVGLTFTQLVLFSEALNSNG